MTTVRVALPTHLRRLAGVEREVHVEVEGESPTIARVLDALEARHPVLKGTIRDHATRERRAFIRFFACGEDLSHEPQEMPLPDRVVSGKEPLRVVGAIAGGATPGGGASGGATTEGTQSGGATSRRGTAGV